MKHKKSVIAIWVLIILCFSLYGCGDVEIQSTLRNLSAPGTADVEITGVPIEIQELLWDDPAYLKERLLRVQQDKTQPDWVEDGIKINICEAEQQRLYYTKYIDAGGIAILGNSDATDAEFRIARDITLRVTAKRPELRKIKRF